MERVCAPKSIPKSLHTLKTRILTLFLFFIFLLVGFVANPSYFREIDLEINVGQEAKTIEEITKTNHLPNLEEQTRVLEAMVDDILNEMSYLKGREAKLRNTNGK